MTSAETDAFRSRDKAAGEKAVGHYTQVVWADSDEVGCGFVERDLISDGKTFVAQVCILTT